jgi:hypothetical protein
VAVQPRVRYFRRTARRPINIAGTGRNGCTPHRWIRMQSNGLQPANLSKFTFISAEIPILCRKTSGTDYRFGFNDA